MFKTLAVLFVCLVPILGLASAATPHAPYALNLLDEYAEYGSNPPPDICEQAKRNPCALRRAIMYWPVTNVETMRTKLNVAAWSALKRAAPDGQEIWVFSVCMDKMSQHPNCFGVYGVAVLSQERVVFYSFFKPKTYPDQVSKE